MKLKTVLLTFIFAALLPAATIDQWKLTEVETNGYTYEAGPFIGYSAYLNFYLPFLESNLFNPTTNPTGIYLTWGYTLCPDPCTINAPRLTNPGSTGSPLIPSPPTSPSPSPTAVPEPAAYGMALIGLLVCAVVFWLRGKRKSRERDRDQE